MSKSLLGICRRAIATITAVMILVSSIFLSIQIRDSMGGTVWEASLVSKLFYIFWFIGAFYWSAKVMLWGLKGK